MKKTILVFGLIAGAIVSLMLILSVGYMKKNGGIADGAEIWGYSSMLLASSMIFVAIKSYRDRYLGGVISFGKAFKVGLGISIVAAILYTLTWVILYKNFYPTFMEDYMAFTIKKMKESGKSATDIEKTVKEMDGMKSIYGTWWGLIGMTIIEILPLELVISVICALILKRKTPKAA